MSKKFDIARWGFTVDGKWQGGSFESEAAAVEAAKKFKGSKTVVFQRGLKPEKK